MKEIVDLMLKDTAKRLEDQELKLEVTDAGKELLVEEGFDEAFGARPLRRAIQKLLEDALAEELLKNRYQPGDTILTDSIEGKIVFK